MEVHVVVNENGLLCGCYSRLDTAHVRVPQYGAVHAATVTRDPYGHATAYVPAMKAAIAVVVDHSFPGARDVPFTDRYAAYADEQVEGDYCLWPSGRVGSASVVQMLAELVEEESADCQ